MFFLFCQPGLKNQNTIDYLIKKLIIKSLKLKKNSYHDINSINKKKSKFKLNSKIEMIKNAFEFYLKLKKLLLKNKIVNIFFDSYTIFDLFFFSLIKFSKSTKVVIYLRIPYDLILPTRIIFNLSINLLKKKNIIYVTDTEQLKNHFKKKFEIYAHVLPIPNKINSISILKKIKNKKIKLLFPGKARDEKGINSIINLFNNEIGPKKIEFKFSKNQKILKSLKNISGLKLNPLNKNLSYKDYITSLKQSDIVILPYDHKTYMLRSSGVFVDAIKLNKFCFVSKNTWMATILKNNKLEFCIMNDWRIDILIKKIEYYEKNYLKIKKNFSKMHKKIFNENSEINFINSIKQLF